MRSACDCSSFIIINGEICFLGKMNGTERQSAKAETITEKITLHVHERARGFALAIEELQKNMKSRLPLRARLCHAVR